jgi:hypothetical protein
MHHDEANQALKFGVLLETGEYRYDSSDHHGPTLYYLTLPSAWIRGQATLASLDERTLRIVPAVFGAGLMLLLLPLAGGFGRPAVAAAALLVALSPALVYYSRFYIQETLLAFFALGFVIALGRCLERPGTGWAMTAGAFAGRRMPRGNVDHRAAFRRPGGEARGHGQGAAQRLGWVRALGSAIAIVIVRPVFTFFRYPFGLLECFAPFGIYAAADRAGPHAHPDLYRACSIFVQRNTVWTEGVCCPWR